MSTITLEQETVSTILFHSFKKIKEITVHVPTIYETKKKKIMIWDKSLPELHLTLKQQKSIHKGILEARQRKGKFI